MILDSATVLAVKTCAQNGTARVFMADFRIAVVASPMLIILLENVISNENNNNDIT